MSQQSSLTQSAHSVRQVLTAYTAEGQPGTHMALGRVSSGGARGSIALTTELDEVSGGFWLELTRDLYDALRPMGTLKALPPHSTS
jgi:hypothetical protein